MEGANLDWRVRSKCSSLSSAESDRMFFPDSGRKVKDAKQFCQDCPVLVQCLEYALTNNECGIWAGTIESERKMILKFRRQVEGYSTPKRIVARRGFVFS